MRQNAERQKKKKKDLFDSVGAFVAFRSFQITVDYTNQPAHNVRSQNGIEWCAVNPCECTYWGPIVGMGHTHTHRHIAWPLYTVCITLDTDHTEKDSLVRITEKNIKFSEIDATQSICTYRFIETSTVDCKLERLTILTTHRTSTCVSLSIETNRIFSFVTRYSNSVYSNGFGVTAAHPTVFFFLLSLSRNNSLQYKPNSRKQEQTKFSHWYCNRFLYFCFYLDCICFAYENIQTQSDLYFSPMNFVLRQEFKSNG